MNKKYQFIIEYINNLILKGELKQGDKLPSIRFVSELLACNKATVIRAYQELVQKHIVYVIPKGGYYLVEHISNKKDIEPIIDFSELLPDPNLLPYQEFNHCINQAIDSYQNQLFMYSDVQGLVTFRNTLVKHFYESHIYTKAEDIFITSGAQQALSILTQMPFPNQYDTILVEQPTYHLIMALAKLHNLNIIGINRDHNGINIDELEQLFRNHKIKFFYLMPRFHNPLGTNLEKKQKQKIVNLANKYEVYLVEDDYLADLDQSKSNLPLYYYDLSDRVIYIKSFSKVFMPGNRIGAVILPKSLQKTFIEYKKLNDLSTSSLTQGALEIFINSGMYLKHLKKIQSEYSLKMNCIHKCLTDNNLLLELINASNGFVVWVKIDSKISIEYLINKLIKKNVKIANPKKYYIDETNHNHNHNHNHNLALCISKLTTDEIKSGLTIIINEIIKLGGL